MSIARRLLNYGFRSTEQQSHARLATTLLRMGTVWKLSICKWNSIRLNFILRTHMQASAPRVTHQHELWPPNAMQIKHKKYAETFLIYFIRQKWLKVWLQCANSHFITNKLRRCFIFGVTFIWNGYFTWLCIVDARVSDVHKVGYIHLNELPFCAFRMHKK